MIHLNLYTSSINSSLENLCQSGYTDSIMKKKKKKAAKLSHFALKLRFGSFLQIGYVQFKITLP